MTSPASPGSPVTREIISQALEHHQAGRLQEAQSLYRQALFHEPNNPDALHLMGVLAAQAGHLTEALELLDRAIAAAPDNAGIHSNRANVLTQLGRHDDAVAAYQKALTLNPGDPDIHVNMGNALRDLRRSAALRAYDTAIRLKPDHADAHSYRGNALRDLGDLPRAIEAYQRAVDLRPDEPVFLSNLGVALSEAGRKFDAIELLQRAVRIDPMFAEARMNLSDTLRDVGHLGESVSAARRAVELQPHLAEARVNLANALMQQGRLEEAINEFIAAITQKPSLHDAGSNLLFALHNRLVDVMWHAEQHRHWARVHAAPLEAKIRPHENDRNPDRRLRVGYVSNDFRDHAVGRLFLPVIESHDHQQVEVFCYSQTTKADDQTAKIRVAADHWHETAGLNDDDLAALIREHKIDILVDLAGHTAGHRLLVFAQKPAPVQVTWMGYPNTTGLGTIDYRIADAVADPPGINDSLFTEKLVRLDGCFLCLRVVDEPIAPKEGGAFTFGCFNNFTKASPDVMKFWARILNEAPATRLLLKARGLALPGTIEGVREVLRSHGLPLERVEIRSQVEKQQHLGTYNEIDLALDSYPYSGTATTCDALSMGVPVVTLAGDTHVSRVSASLLTAAGLSEWIAANEDAYVRRAIEAAAKGKRSTADRQALREKLAHSPLCDEKSFTRKLEAAYRQMWRKWCQ